MASKFSKSARVGLTSELHDAIEGWAAVNAPERSLPEAIRLLIREGMSPGRQHAGVPGKAPVGETVLSKDAGSERALVAATNKLVTTTSRLVTATIGVVLSTLLLAGITLALVRDSLEATTNARLKDRAETCMALSTYHRENADADANQDRQPSSKINYNWAYAMADKARALELCLAKPKADCEMEVDRDEEVKAESRDDLPVWSLRHSTVAGNGPNKDDMILPVGQPTC